MTTDGGESWSAEQLNIYADVSDIFALDDEHVYALGTFGGVILKRSPADVTTVSNSARMLPAAFELLQNYPNPFNPSTTITYTLTTAAEVELTIYNVLGERVRVLLHYFQVAGEHALVWDGRNDAAQTLSSGLYLCRLNAGGVIRTKRMMLLK